VGALGAAAAAEKTAGGGSVAIAATNANINATATTNTDTNTSANNAHRHPSNVRARTRRGHGQAAGPSASGQDGSLYRKLNYVLTLAEDLSFEVETVRQAQSDGTAPRPASTVTAEVAVASSAKQRDARLALGQRLRGRVQSERRARGQQRDTDHAAREVQTRALELVGAGAAVAAVWGVIRAGRARRVVALLALCAQRRVRGFLVRARMRRAARLLENFLGVAVPLHRSAFSFKKLVSEVRFIAILGQRVQRRRVAILAGRRQLLFRRMALDQAAVIDGVGQEELLGEFVAMEKRLMREQCSQFQGRVMALSKQQAPQRGARAGGSAAAEADAKKDEQAKARRAAAKARVLPNGHNPRLLQGKRMRAHLEDVMLCGDAAARCLQRTTRGMLQVLVGTLGSTVGCVLDTTGAGTAVACCLKRGDLHTSKPGSTSASACWVIAAARRMVWWARTGRCRRPCTGPHQTHLGTCRRQKLRAAVTVARGLTAAVLARSRSSSITPLFGAAPPTPAPSSHCYTHPPHPPASGTAVPPHCRTPALPHCRTPALPYSRAPPPPPLPRRSACATRATRTWPCACPPP
jgi:hypothetical protein